jgi:hypothetical protein
MFTTDCYATVRNFSADTIHRFYINSPILGGVNCAHYLYSILVTQGIAPFDSVTVYIAAIDQRRRTNTFFELCLFTVAPNSVPDVNLSNDSICAQIFISSILGIESSADVSVFPNPSSNSFVLSLTDDMKEAEITVHTLSGAIFMKQKAAGKETLMDVSRWSKGLYTITVQSDVRSARGKLVVE